MATFSPKKDSEPSIPRGIPPKALMRWGTFLKLFGPIFKALGISLDGIDGVETADGLHLRGGATRINYPWTIRMGSDSGKRFITAGTFANVVPEISGVRLDDSSPPQLDISVGVVNYVYLKSEPTVNRTDGFVSDFVFAQGDVEAVAETTVQVDDGAEDIFYTLIATIDENGKATQFRSASMDATIDDSGADESISQIHVFT